MAKTTESDYKTHIDYITDHSKYNSEDGLRTMTRSDYAKMVEAADGITPNILDAVNTSQERVIGAAIHVTTDDHSARVRQARDAGDDPSQLKNTLRIATPGGSTEITVRATRTRIYPRTGDLVTKHGVVGVSIDADKRIPDSAAERARSVITQALGLSESNEVEEKVG